MEKLNKDVDLPSIRFSEMSLSNSKLDDFQQVNRLSNESDFAAYFALSRITMKLQDKESLSTDPVAKQAKSLYSALRWPRKIIILTYLLITIFQKPTWCNSSEYSNDCQTQLEEGYAIPTTISHYLPIKAYYIIEILLICILLFLKGLKTYSMTMLNYQRRIFSICLLAIGIIVILNDIVVIILDNDYAFNVSTLLKPFFIVCYSQIFLNTIKDYAIIIYRGKEIYYLMAFSLIFFVGIGTAIFRDQYDYKEVEAQTGICDVSNVPFSQKNYCTFLIMLQLQTTVNSPDSFLPYYENNRIAIIYFMLFQFINTILMINLILALFYSQYKKLIEERTLILKEQNQDKIEKYTRKFLRKRQSSIISVFGNRYNQQTAAWQITFRIIDHYMFKAIMQVLCLADFLLIFYDNTDKDIQITNLSLNFAMMIEAIVIALLRGSSKITKHPGLLFDLIISPILVAFVIAILNLDHDKPTQDILIRVSCAIMSLRLFRGCAWLLNSKNFTLLLIKISSISSYLIQLFGTVLVLFTFFTALGQLAFGGKINMSLEYENDYQMVNYNDFLSGFCTCWFLIIVNNWNFISLNFASSLQNDYAYLFFFFYYIVVVLLALSVTVALLIEYLVNQLKREGDLDIVENKEIMENNSRKESFGKIDSNRSIDYQNDLCTPLQQRDNQFD